VHRSLAGIGLLLLLGGASLSLGTVTSPEAGLAAPIPVSPPDGIEQPPSTVTTLVTHTVYLPFAIHPELIVPNAWLGAYYANNTLSGDPEYTTEEARVDFDWGDGGSPAGLPADRFSIRWVGHWDFEIGEYTFFAHADDGIRLWLGNDLLIDRWQVGVGSYQASAQIETAGLQRLKVEYFEETGGATVRLHWRRTDLYPQWDGDYYVEPWVEHGWVDQRTDSVIQFDWGLSCPDSVQPHCDRFSIAWNANRLFEPGTHRIFLYADEGYQLFVDGNKVKEGGWYDGQGGGAEDTGYVLEVGNLEHHQITYNFHDRGTLAEARLWIVYMEHPTWLIEFFENKNLEGQPKFTDPDGYKIFFDWGFGGPWSQTRSDEFSIRWSGQRYFHAGCYRFGLFADDGVRLWIDGEKLVDAWHDGRGEHHSPVTFLSTGYHQVVVEYYENIGEAEIRFWWE
jgi:hypothetical protein